MKNKELKIDDHIKSKKCYKKANVADWISAISRVGMVGTLIAGVVGMFIATTIASVVSLNTKEMIAAFATPGSVLSSSLLFFGLAAVTERVAEHKRRSAYMTYLEEEEDSNEDFDYKDDEDDY